MFGIRFLSLSRASPSLMGSSAWSSASSRTFVSSLSLNFSSTTVAPLVSAAAPAFSATELVRDMRRGVNGCGAGIHVPKAPKKVARSAATLVARTASVHAGLESQVKRRADYRKTLPTKPSRSGLLQYIKKNAWEKE